MKKEIFKTIKDITLNEDSTEVIIEFVDGCKIRQYHEQDCCESVFVSQVDGSVLKHIGAEMYSIDEKVTHEEEDYESCTSTFYTMQTSKGYLDWRWQGFSNGYYSESVDMDFTGIFPEL